MTVPEYPKIDTLFDRDPVTHKVKETRIRRPEFEIPFTWTVTEKVDGTNVRVSLERECSVCSGPDPVSGDFFSCDTADAPHTGWRVVFYGRTAAAQMPTFLLEYLQRTFTLEKMTGLWRGKPNCERCDGTGREDSGQPKWLSETASPFPYVCDCVEPYPIAPHREG